MSQKYTFYAVIGNNGYGITRKWMDVFDNAKLFENEWHRGFNDLDEAYEWILKQSAFRHDLNESGICDLDTLEVKKFVFLHDKYKRNNTKKSVKGTFNDTESREDLFNKFLTWLDKQDRK